LSASETCHLAAGRDGFRETLSPFSDSIGHAQFCFEQELALPHPPHHDTLATVI
jgi:hypothetical protein